MKVRDLKQYIREVSKGEDHIELLGTNSEPFLTYMSGHKGEPLDTLLVSVASFASNAKEQLFYEFVQNAYDANADSLFFYANEKYLIVLNNGTPFYTDLNIHDEDKQELPRDGQLYNFLNKGDSTKLNRDDQLGKYGQGSKLLYTLLADVNNTLETEILLKDVIIAQKKGPYLISWDNMSQLDALLINNDEWIPAQADDVENNILFAKILMSYYPIAPGQATEFFSNQEAQDVIHAFDELVDPKRNKSFLTRGTALIIPLGKGKYEAIVSENNLENVRERLGGFASITADQEQNVGKSLKHIYVMKQEIEQHPVKSLFVDFTDQGKHFEYHFAFNPIFAEKNVVNFFKGLPILQTKYRFGFILDSQVLEVDDSRQRFTDIDKTCNQFKTALEYLVQKLKELKNSDRETFDYVYKSIVASFPGDRNSEEEQKIWKTFYEVIRPFLNDYALTEDNTYVSFDEICAKEKGKEIDVKLKDLGIEDLHWIDPNISFNFKKHFTKELRVYGFSEMLCDADEDKLAKWIKNMSHENYRLFQQYCLDCIEKEDEDDDKSIKGLKVFRSNKNNLFSYTELRSSLNIYYLSYQSEFSFAGQEYIIEPVCVDYYDEDYKVLYTKIKSNIETIRKTAIGRNTACDILYRISIDFEDLAEEIQSEIPVLQNRKGDYRPFNDLMADRPNDSILFEDFLVKGAIPENIKNTDWLVDKKEEKDAVWNWICRNFNQLKIVDGWRENAHHYIADIKRVYEKAGCPRSISDILHLYLNEDGQPVQKKCYDVEGFRRLTKEEYALIEEEFSNYSFVPYEFHDELTFAPFGLDTLFVTDLLDSNHKVEFNILSLLAKMEESFFLRYRIIGTDNIYDVRQIGSGKNYCDELNIPLRQALTEIGYYYIPSKVQGLMGQNRSAFTITRDDFILPIIDKIKDKILLFPIIKQCRDEAKDKYIESLDTPINIDSKLTQDDVKWELIKFAVSNGYTDEIFSLLKYNNESLPKSIKETSVVFNDHLYDLYKLNFKYKEENSKIDSFLECLPDSEWFIDEFYDDKKEIVPVEDIYKYLHNKYLTIEQLRFCLDYSLNSEEEPQYENLEIDGDEDLKAALDMIVENEFEGFDKYFKIEDFNPDCQVYADKLLLNDEEQLPEELYEWLSQHEWLIQNGYPRKFFNKLRTIYNDSYISIRKSIVEDTIPLSIPNCQDEEFTQSTVDWLLNYEKQYVYNGIAFNTINRFIDQLPDVYTPMVFLKYTGAIDCNNERGEINPIFILDEYNVDSCFFSSAAWTPTFKEKLRENKKIKQFFENNRVYLYNEEVLLFRHKLRKSPKLEVSVRVNDGDYNEIDNPVYNKWKQMEGSRGILIKTSEQPIGISFSMKKGGKEVFSIGIDNTNLGYGYIVNELVVVQMPNKDQLSVIKMIEKNIQYMEFFKEPFILLQGLYVEQVEALEKIAEGKGTDISTIVSQSIQNGGQNGTGDASNNGNLKVDDEKIEFVKTLAESFETEELQELADNKDKLLEALYNLQGAEDETQESLVRQTIGYIGELIYEQYLKDQGKEYKYAAIEGIGDYDFHNKTDKTYIDVKTTLYSLKEGTAPFYLHRSQNMFMQKHPNEKYHIIRISLNDLNLQQSYERIRDKYGKDANPMEDERLKAACKKLAKDYWKDVKIEEFDALSPEYSIRIEQKKK